jgi:hypothetical protein
MNLIGTKVCHTKWGVGTVVNIDGEYMYIEFSIGTKRMAYPGAFEQFITAEDSDVQAAMMNAIQEIKDAEAKRKLEEEAMKQAKAAAEADRLAAHSKSGTPKKKKSLDEMFAPDYHADKLARQPILTYEQVETKFGIQIAGFGRGINPTDSNVVLISSINKAGGAFVYHDKWTVDGDYLYSGEGRFGDQSMTKGNLAIKDAASDGKEIHLFVKFSPQEYYYQGIFELVEYTYEDDKDEGGNIRKEYKFLLRKVKTVVENE